VLIDSAGVAAGSTMSRYMLSLDYLAAEFLRHPCIRASVGLVALIKNKRLVDVDAQLCASLHLQMPTNWSQALIIFY